MEKRCSPEQDTRMTSAQPSHFEKLWLAESLRQLETDAWLDDKAILMRLATENADEEYGPCLLYTSRCV